MLGCVSWMDLAQVAASYRNGDELGGHMELASLAPSSLQ